VTNARWATFDCYGTLVDWNVGVQAELERLFGTDQGPRLLQRYHELEPRTQRENPQARYRDVMSAVLAAIASESGRDLTEEDRDALGRSLAGWPLFPEARRCCL
jgi:2-haloacid dehalogenase